MGAISGAGIGAGALWAAARDGKSAIGPVELERPGQNSIKIAAQVKRFDPAQHMDRSSILLCDRFTQFAIVAADEAMAQAKLPREEKMGGRMMGRSELNLAIAGVSKHSAKLRCEHQFPIMHIVFFV